MVYPDSIDNLTDRPNGSEVRSQDPNDAYAALRDLRTDTDPTDGDAMVWNGSLGKWDADSDTYVKADTIHVGLGADWKVIRNSPTLSDVDRWVGWSFPKSGVAEGIGRAISTDESWSTFDVDLWWLNEGAGSGVVQWLLHHHSLGEGGTITGTPGSMGDSLKVDSTAGAQNELVVATFTGLTAGSGDDLEMINVFRNSGATPDDLSNAAMGMKLTLRKAS